MFFVFAFLTKMAVKGWKIVTMLLVWHVVGGTAEESDGWAQHSSRSPPLWVESYSQEWSLGADGSTISCYMKGTMGREAH